MGQGWGMVGESVTYSQLPIVSPFLSQLGKKMDTGQKQLFFPLPLLQWVSKHRLSEHSEDLMI